MSINDENFIVDLCDKAESIDEWLAVIRFGLNVLLERQDLFIELITRRAVKEADASKAKSRKPSDEAPRLLRLLGLQLVMTPTPETP